MGPLGNMRRKLGGEVRPCGFRVMREDCRVQSADRQTVKQTYSSQYFDMNR